MGAQLDGLHHEVNGSGPWLVLVSGLGGMSSFWAAQVAMLSARFSTVTYDHRGVGRSQPAPRHCSIESMARDLSRLMDHLGIARAVLVGHSTGGAIAQTVAAEHPSRVARLVLSASWAHPDPYLHRVLQLRRDILEALGPGAYIRASHLFLYPPDWIGDHDEELRRAESPDPARVAHRAFLLSRLDALLAFDGRARLAQIRAPTLVIGAQDDVMTPPRLQRNLSAGIAGARLHLLKRGAHYSPVTEPERYNAAISDFLGAPQMLH